MHTLYLCFPLCTYGQPVNELYERVVDDKELLRRRVVDQGVEGVFLPLKWNLNAREATSTNYFVNTSYLSNLSIRCLLL